jgi:hypothetical protein
VQLRLDPGGRDPATWKEEWKGFGAATSIRGGVIEAFLIVPTPSFQTPLVAIGLGKVRFVTFNVDFAEDRGMASRTRVYRGARGSLAHAHHKESVYGWEAIVLWLALESDPRVRSPRLGKDAS